MIARFLRKTAVLLSVGLIAVTLAGACGGDDLNCDDILNDEDTSDECRTQIAELPGTFVPSQGRTHFNRTFDRDFPPTSFCGGVATADTPGAGSVTPPDGDFSCYASNPPSSGFHLPSQANADLGNGISIRIPPDPDTYPDDIEIPREAIPHILEHAGVFIGWNCAAGDAACEDVAAQLERIADDRIDNGKRVVFAHDSDLPEGTIGLSSWTRVDTFPVAEFRQDRVVTFIDTHSCRFDPEGFC